MSPKTANDLNIDLNKFSIDTKAGGSLQRALGIHSNRVILAPTNPAKRFGVKLTIPLIAIAAFFFLTAIPEDAFADFMPSYGTLSAPTVHHREMTESISVTSAFDGPVPARTFSRTLNDGITIYNSFSPPHQVQQAQAQGSTSQRAGGFPAPFAIQRTDERLTFKSASKVATGSVGGTVYDSAVSPFSGLQKMETDAQAEQSLQELLNSSGDGEDPDSNSSFLRQLEIYASVRNSTHNAMILDASISAVLLAGTAAVVVARLPAVSDGRTQEKVIAFVTLKHACPEVTVRRKASNTSATYLFLLVLVILMVPTIAVSIGTSVGQEYSIPSKSRIEITSAYHLDSNRQVLDDISDKVREFDGLWSSEIPDNHYVRVTFEQALTSANDIRIFVKIVSGEPRIEIYEKDGAAPIAQYAVVNDREYSRTFLNDLQGSQDTFDIHVAGGSVEFDHIVDPHETFNVQRGTSTIAGTNPLNVSISAVDTSKAIVLISARASGTVAQTANILHVTATLTSSTNLQLQRESTSTSNTVTVSWQVIESSSFSVERGTATTPATTTSSMNVSLLNPVDLRKSFIIVTARMNDGTAANNVRNFWTAEFTSPSAFTLTRGTTGTVATVSWQVVQWEGATVQRGTTNATTTANATISEVDTSTSFIYVTKRAASASNSVDTMAHAFFNSSTEIAVRRGGTTGTTTVSWFVVSHPALKTQTGSLTFSASSAQNISITSVTTARTFALSAETSATASTNYGQVFTTSTLTSSTNLALQKGATTTSVTSRWFVVEFVPQPDAPTLYPADGTNQIAFNNFRENTTTPTFRVSAEHTASFNRFQLELNTKADFTGTAYTQTFSGTYSSGTQYNLTANGLSPTLPSTDGATYYVRMRASDNAGTNWSNWSSGTWSFTKGSASNPDWFQQKADQFATGTITTLPSIQYDSSAGTSSGTGNALTLSFSHTLNAGSNRMVIISVGSENGNAEIDVASVTYGGQAATLGAEEIIIGAGTGTTGFRALSEIWYLLEEDLPSNGSNTVVITFTGTAASLEVNGAAFTLTGVKQEPPDAVRTAWQVSQGTNLSMFTDIIPLVDRSWLIDVMTGGDPVTPTAGTDQVVRHQIQDASSTFNVSTKASVSASLQTMGWSHTNINRQAHAIIAVSEVIETIRSPAIDFDWVPGASSWGSFNWSEDETNGTIKVQLYYNNGGTPTIVPDSALPGNSSGFSTGPINISGLSTTTYNEIYLLATFTGSPVLVNWNIAWNFVQQYNRGISDSLAVADSTTPRVNRRVADSVSLADSIKTRVSRSPTDAVTVADTISTRTSRSVSDALSTTDAISPRVSRAVSDTVAFTDTISTSVSRAISDSLAISDTIAAKVTRRVVSDSLAITDAVSFSVSRSAQDSLAITDAIAMSVSRSISENLSITDAVTGTPSRSMGDELAVTDTIAMSITRSIADTLTVIDATATSLSATRSIADELSVADAAVRTVSRSAADSLSIADAITTSISRSISDTIALADSISMSVTRSIADSLTVTDEISSVPNRAVSDGLSVSDAISTFVSRGISDSVALADSISMSVSRSLLDSLTAADTISMSVTRSIVDTLSITDSATGSPTKSVNDELTIADSISTAVTRSVQDEVSIDDSISMSVTRTINDELMIEDVAARSTSRSASDEVTLDDAITTAVTRSLNDSLTLDDTISLTISVTYSIAEGLTLDDSISMSVTRSIEDVLSILEEAAPSTGRTTDDSLTLTDSISMSVTRSMVESLSTTDAISISVTRSIEDSLSLDDEAAVVNAYTASASDTLSVTDEIARARAVPRAAEDSLSVADAISIRVTFYLDDSVTVTESIRPPEERTASDSLAVTDEITVSYGIAVAISDSLAVTAQLTDISVHWNKVFDESLALGDCTPFSCNQALILGESLALGSDTGFGGTTKFIFAVSPSVLPAVKQGETSTAFTVFVTAPPDFEVANVRIIIQGLGPGMTAEWKKPSDAGYTPYGSATPLELQPGPGQTLTASVIIKTSQTTQPTTYVMQVTAMGLGGSTQTETRTVQLRVDPRAQETQVVPSIVVTPSSTTAGGTVLVTGTGFTPGSTITQITLGATGQNNPPSIKPAGTITVNPDGTWTTSAVVPPGTLPGNYVVRAVASDQKSAQTVLRVTTSGSFEVYLSTDEVTLVKSTPPQGKEIAMAAITIDFTGQLELTVSNLPLGMKVKYSNLAGNTIVEFAGRPEGNQRTGNPLFTPESTGTLPLLVTITAEEATQRGTYAVFFGAKNPVTGTSKTGLVGVTVAAQGNPTITFSPLLAQPGASVNVQGVNFAASQPVTLQFGSMNPGTGGFSVTPSTVVTAADGTFSAAFTVPNVAGGIHQVKATVGSGQALSTFQVLPTPPAPSVKLQIAPKSLVVPAGSSGHQTVTVVPIGAFSSDVTLVATPQQAGIGSVTFAPMSTISITPGTPSPVRMDMTVSAGAAVDTLIPLKVEAKVGGTTIATETAYVRVASPNVSGDFFISASNNDIVATKGTTITSTIYVITTGLKDSPVPANKVPEYLNLSGLPAGVTGTITNISAMDEAGTVTARLDLVVSADAAVGTTNFRVNGKFPNLDEKWKQLSISVIEMNSVSEPSSVFDPTTVTESTPINLVFPIGDGGTLELIIYSLATDTYGTTLINYVKLLTAPEPEAVGTGLALLFEGGANMDSDNPIVSGGVSYDMKITMPSPIPAGTKIGFLDTSVTPPLWTEIPTEPCGDNSICSTERLTHFSSWSLIAPTSAPPISGGSSRLSFAVQLVDEIGLGEASQSTAVVIIEEFLQPKKISVFLSDLVAVKSKPVALPQEIKVDKDITVKVSVLDISQPSPTGLMELIELLKNPSALAQIQVEITNRGDADRQFELEFTYNDARGNLYRQTIEIDVEGGTTATRIVEIPFAEPGVYNITAIVRDLPGRGLSGSSTLTIEIPWLELQVNALYAVAASILAVSGLAVLILLKRRQEVRLFARDEEEFKKDHRYQVLAKLELREVIPSGPQLTAVFSLDVWSKNDGMEFVVTYRAVDMSGVTVHESSMKVPAAPDLQSIPITMLFGSQGHYTIYAEARPELGGKVLDKATLPVQISLQ